jgi:hypothetical protein
MTLDRAPLATDSSRVVRAGDACPHGLTPVWGRCVHGWIMDDPQDSHLGHRVVRCRRDWVCEMCGRTISQGEDRVRDAAVVDGSVRVEAVCRGCWHLLAVVEAHCDGIGDHGGSIPDWFVAGGPDTLAELRLVVWWLRGWRRDDGSLTDLPSGVVG